eukprot:5307917-Pyramimonas_sp.AAC.1
MRVKLHANAATGAFPHVGLRRGRGEPRRRPSRSPQWAKNRPRTTSTHAPEPSKRLRWFLRS